MEILKIRENFNTSSPYNHSLSDIKNFDSKWKQELSQYLDKLGSPFKKQCLEVSDQVNCISFKKESDTFHLKTSYLIGLDYISSEIPFMVEPKFNDPGKGHSVDFYKILFGSLHYVKSTEDISDLYHIDFSKSTIEIEQKDDFLTPILVFQFMSYIHDICRSGLQKGYYKVERNLESKIKGKILIKETIKQNHIKSNYTKTVCTYREFGVNTIENQFLKYTWKFCLNYLGQFEAFKIDSGIRNKIGFIESSISRISYNNSFRKPITVIKNPLYPLYEKALKLANLILKRSAFNITNTTKKTVETYPFWIDMSQLFELHVLGLLRKKYPNGVDYQKVVSGLKPDYLLDTGNQQFVVDAKYKFYENDSKDMTEDVRQVAAYTRMKEVFNHFDIEESEARGRVLDAIIIYPDTQKGVKEIPDLVNLGKEEIPELRDYYNIYKLGVYLPLIEVKA